MTQCPTESVGKTILQSAESFFQYRFEPCQKAFLTAYDGYSGEKTALFFPLDHSATFIHKYCPKDLLGTDVVYLGDTKAQHIFVFISGTHGVEGFCGSAIQQFLLKQLSEQMLPKDTAILMIHSLNPWGMFWARRCDEAGIDLNRNFVDYQNLEAPDPEYDKILDTLVNSPNPFQEMQRQSEKWGQQRFDGIFSGGQYVHQWAPFYGGRQASHGRKVIENLINKFQLASRNTMVVDLHTGLGPWAFGELISDHPENSSGNAHAKAIFGAAIANSHEGTSFSVPKSGLLDYCFHEFMSQQGFFLTLEFGSYGSASLFNTLLNDHILWRDVSARAVDLKNVIDEPVYQLNRQKMLAHFCPNDRLWQQAVLFKSWQIFQTLCLSISD